MDKKFLILGLIIIGVIAYFVTDYINNKAESGVISASGNVEVTEVNLGFKIPGRITELLAEEGQRVEKGSIIAKLDNSELKSIVLQNEAALNEAQAHVDQLRAGSRSQDIKQAELGVQSAESLVLESEAKLEQLKNGARPQEIQEAQLNVKAFELMLEENEIRLDELKKGSRTQEIEQANANLEAADVEVSKAKKDLDRADTLYKNGAISSSQFDATKSTYDSKIAQYKNAKEKVSLIKEGARKEDISAYEKKVEQIKNNIDNAKVKVSLIKEGARKEEIKASEQRLEQAKVQFEKAKVMLSLVKEGTRKEEIRVYERKVEQAKAALATAEEKLKDTILYAPKSGIVLKRNIEQGETVGQGSSVYNIGDLENPWIKIYIKETNLGHVKLGQQVEIKNDSFPNKKYQGVVTYISSEAEFTPKNIQTKEERIKLVFEVKVSVKNENYELKPGMPADARIKQGLSGSP